MRNRHIAVILLVCLLAGLMIACGNKGPKQRKIMGSFDNWNEETSRVTINGQEYPVAEGMKQFAGRAELGKTYEFTLDIHGNVIAVEPV